MIYKRRTIESVVKDAAAHFPALIITGPRQSGKTTLLKHLFSKTHNYVSLDNPDVRLMAIEEPELFLENYPCPVIIDEIQYAPALFSYLKIKIEEHRSKQGQFLLTGSQAFSIMAGVSESLAGRIAVLTLLSFSMKEQVGCKKMSYSDLRAITLKGGFPEIALKKHKNLNLWFSSYLQTYLERDVRQLRQIGDLTDFQRFLKLLASLNGQVLNLSTLSRDIGVSVSTVKAWVSVLEASHQIMLLNPFYKNKGKRITKSPKIYFLDTGFLCYLNGIFNEDQIFKGPLSGQLFENVILGEIMRSFYNRGELPRIYWWRTSHGEEVDFIVERGDKISPIEVKLTTRINKGLTRNLESFCNLFREDVSKGVLINLAGRTMDMGNNIVAMPLQNFINELNYL